LLLTWIIALFPVVALLILLAVVRLSAWAATLIGSIFTFLLGLYVWRTPLGDSIRAYHYGSPSWTRIEPCASLHSRSSSGCSSEPETYPLQHRTSNYFS
jgi:hypothetical protein